MSSSHHDSLSDDELLSRVAGGDAPAFTALFRRRQGQVYRFALHLSASSSVAEDVTQDVFMTIIRDAGRYEAGRSSVAAWLCGIARNLTLRRLERERVIVPLTRQNGDTGPAAPCVRPDPIGELAQAERVDALRIAIASLPIRYREAVVLCDLQEMSYADAAVVIGCAIGTVRSRLHRGRALLTTKMQAVETGRSGAVEERVRKAVARCFV
jgi:RNA polymerase sigma-70 factor (ECF subfamily)